MPIEYSSIIINTERRLSHSHANSKDLLASQLLQALLIIVLAIQDPQNRQEQVQNVQIQTDRSSNLLLNLVMSDDQLGVHQNVPAEDQRRNDSISELDTFRLREESRHEPEKDQNPQCAEEVWHPGREIVFRLTREDGQEDEDSERKYERLQHDSGFVEGCDHRNRVRL